MPDRDDSRSIKLSIVIPSHNLGPWIVECIRSLQRQNVDDMEIIVIEDHSTDSSINDLLILAQADSRIRLISADDFGAARARNQGALLARGEYLIFIDGDDIIPDGAYQSMVSSLDNSGSDVALGNFLTFSAERTWEQRWAGEVFGQPRYRTTLREMPALVQGRTCWNKMFRRDFWESSGIKFPEVLQSNDIVPILRALIHAQSIDLVPDFVYLYRKRPGNSSITAQSRYAKSLHSYLIEESECARLLAQHGDAHALDTYFEMALTEVTWSHLSRFLESQTDRAVSDLGPAAPLLKRFVESAPLNIREALSIDRKRTFALCGENLAGVLNFLHSSSKAIGGSDAHSEIALVDLRRATMELVDESWTRPDMISEVLRLRLLRSILEHLPALDDELLGDLMKVVGICHGAQANGEAVGWSDLDLAALSVCLRGNVSDLRWYVATHQKASASGSILSSTARQLTVEVLIDGFEGDTSFVLKMVGRVSGRSTLCESSSKTKHESNTFVQFLTGRHAARIPETWDLSLLLSRNGYIVELPIHADAPIPQTPAGRLRRLIAHPVRRGDAIVVEFRAHLLTRLKNKLRWR